MQTTGAAQLATKRRSQACVLMPAQDGRSAHGLLYLTAVSDNSCQQEDCQGRVDIGALVRLILNPPAGFMQQLPGSAVG
jgi:hypothetical protein